MVQEELPIVPVTPNLELLYTSRIEIGTPLSLGKAPYGERHIINITGGAFFRLPIIWQHFTWRRRLANCPQ